MIAKHKIGRSLTALAAGLGVFGLIDAAQAGPISIGNIITATGGNVSVTFNSFEAGDTDNLSLYLPTSIGNIIINQSTPLGTTINLGYFAAGVELEFALFDAHTLNTFYTGPGSRNGDGDVHADVSNSIDGLTSIVKFEDLFGNSSDWDYNDLVFTVNQVQGDPPPPSVPDASATLPLLGMGLAGLAAIARRFKK